MHSLEFITLNLYINAYYLFNNNLGSNFVNILKKYLRE